MQFYNFCLMFLYWWTFVALTATANSTSDIPLFFTAQQTNLPYPHLLIRASTNLEAKMWNSQTQSTKFSSVINKQHSEVCACEGILSLSLSLHSPARGNAIPPLCKLTAYTHSETPDLGLRRRFQKGMILINSRGVLLLRPIANKLKKKTK